MWIKLIPLVLGIIYTIRMVQILKYTLLYTTMFMVEASIMCQAFLHVERTLAIQSLYLSRHLILVYYITQRRTHVKSQLHSGP